MAEPPVALSAVALRLAGHVGQTALDRIEDGGAAAVAELDQHTAAVRAELAACQEPLTGAQLAGQAASRATTRGTRWGRRGRVRYARDLAAKRARTRSTDATCPDVPFVASAVHAQETVPIKLLLHYACGFIEAAVSSDWWPADSADATDWVSLRLAAICQLIIAAEAAAELHPDLRAIA
jgi:hypothetical protein